MQSLENIVARNNPPLNERLRKAHNRNDACVLDEEDVHALVELLDALEDEPGKPSPVSAALRRVRGRR